MTRAAHPLARRDVAGDAVLAAVVGAGALAGHLLSTRVAGLSGPLDWLGWLLLLVGAAALVVRRRMPVVVVVITGAAVVATYALSIDHQGPFIMLPMLVALYTATEAGHRTPAVVVAAAVVAVFGLLVLLSPPDRGDEATQALLWATGWMIAAVVTGEVVRGRRDYLREVEGRAVEAERTREEEARRRAGEERLRIARELHDVLGHSLSLINVRAGVAAHVIEQQPDHAREALETIRHTSKQALDELRATLGALQPAGDHAPRHPTPSLDRLRDLVEPVTAAGVEIDVQVDGEPRPLPASVDRAAYRIIQESLTNVLRHARAGAATVHLAYRPDQLVVEVVDDGEADASDAQLREGRGVAGMRERAVAMGGDCTVSVRPGGGVHVRATLPVEETP